MKTFHTRSPAFLAGGLALALMAASAYAATPPADPDPTSKQPMEDTTLPKTQSTTPYSTSSDASAAASDSQQISMQSKFDSLDVNHDGYIDKQEAAADPKLQQQFARLDANKDSKLSMKEFSNAKGLALNKKPKSSNDKSGTDQYK